MVRRCEDKTLKYLVGGFNLLLFVGGIVLIILAAVALNANPDKVKKVSEGFRS